MLTKCLGRDSSELFLRSRQKVFADPWSIQQTGNLGTEQDFLLLASYSVICHRFFHYILTTQRQRPLLLSFAC